MRPKKYASDHHDRLLLAHGVQLIRLDSEQPVRSSLLLVYAEKHHLFRSSCEPPIRELRRPKYVLPQSQLQNQEADLELQADLSLQARERLEKIH